MKIALTSMSTLPLASTMGHQYKPHGFLDDPTKGHRYKPHEFLDDPTKGYRYKPHGFLDGPSLVNCFIFLCK